MNAPFNRTECACTDCVACCKTQPGSLIPGDIERIAAYLGKPIPEVLHLFRSSPGAKLLNVTTNVVYRQRTITPATTNRKGRCVFLDENDRCKIHPVAPAACAYFDTHMGVRDAQLRSQWIAREQSDPAYQELRKLLKIADTYNPGEY